MLVDSHCHLDRLGNLTLALEAAHQHKVEHLLCVSIHLENLQTVLEIATQYPNITASIGVHPTELYSKPDLTAQLLVHMHHPKVVAIGETGLDYARNETLETQKQQQNQFRIHINVARQAQKPLIIHTRKAENDTLSILSQEHAEQVGGVFHCFTESWNMAKAALDLGFFISFSGIITFKNAEAIRLVAKKVPLDRILIETDAPYLAPQPFRGQPNEPAYVEYTARCLAELRGQSFETIADETTRNFYRCFRVAPS